MLAMALLAATACAAAEAASAGARPVDADWILARLARPSPSRTGFVELRDSALLKAPLRIAGEYRRPDADTLVREVRVPYAETTTIVADRTGAGTVRIERAGQPPRVFPLARVPELAGLQASFGALLAGDRARLEQHFALASDGTRQRWTLVLTPRDATLAAKLRALVLYGRGAELRCIETRPAGAGTVQRTLLAGAARAAAGVEPTTALVALCHTAP